MITEHTAFARTRVAYEVGRGREAVVSSLPVALFAGGAMALGHSTWIAASVLMLSIVLHFVSARVGSGVLPGVALGLIPSCAPMLSMELHGCDGASCTTQCMLACSVAGFVAGGLAALLLRRDRFAIGGAVIVIACVGAFGCAWMGTAALAAMTIAAACGGALTMAFPAPLRA